MNLTLTYDGELKANGSVKHKHAIRRAFHLQLLEFWKASAFKPTDELMISVGPYQFFPLVSSARNESAQLRILMLRPGIGPGFIVTQTGDIDNRLKTLFDALRMPRNMSEIPVNDERHDNEDPFFCLLQDDILVTALSVSTDRLLEPCKSKTHVKLVLSVQTAREPVVGANMVLIGSRL